MLQHCTFADGRTTLHQPAYSISSTPIRIMPSATMYHSIDEETHKSASGSIEKEKLGEISKLATSDIERTRKKVDLFI